MKFARTHLAPLASRPVRLFSSGPLGTDLLDTDRQDLLQATRPKEFDELTDLLHPRGEQILFGACDPHAKPIGMGERLVRHMPATKDTLPAGDFRDWSAIEAWARGIAQALGVDDHQPQ